MKIFQGITFAAYLCLALCCGVVLYKVHEQVQAVERWVSAIDETIAKHATILQKHEGAVSRLIDRIRPGDAPRDSPNEGSEQSKLQPSSQPGIPTDIGLFDVGKPTVLMHSLPGCRPCKEWLRDEAPDWLAAGWVVKSTQSKTSKPTPYWTLYDGKKFFEFTNATEMAKLKFDGGYR
jgi:hypothetical protein